MQPRMNPYKTAPETYKALKALNDFVNGNVDHKLLHLLKLRASQINGCAFCIDMHIKEALDDGEDLQRLNLLTAWRESPLYSDKERAMLAWTESVTLVSQTNVPDADYEAMRKHFSEAEIVNLTVAVGVINLWNRWSIAFRSQHPVGMDKRVR